MSAKIEILFPSAQVSLQDRSFQLHRTIENKKEGIHLASSSIPSAVFPKEGKIQDCWEMHKGLSSSRLTSFTSFHPWFRHMSHF